MFVQTLICDHCLNLLAECDCPIESSDPFGFTPIPSEWVDKSEDLMFSFPVDQPAVDNSHETFELNGNYCLGCDEFVDELGECGCRDNSDDHYFTEYN